ncbi:MAG: hypothetical protein DLD55_01605 [candidate division SR1 bacterium]|nr:MAG: hypothetical protein DLD55_01605 [candidate division SR1 bacterium]
MAIHLKASVIARRNRGNPLEIQSAYPLDCFAPLAMTVIAKEQSECGDPLEIRKEPAPASSVAFPIEADQLQRTTSEPTKWEGVSLRSHTIGIKTTELALLVLALFAYFLGQAKKGVGWFKEGEAPPFSKVIASRVGKTLLGKGETKGSSDRSEGMPEGQGDFYEKK